MKSSTTMKESHGSELTRNGTTERIAYSVQETAQALGCTRTFVYALMKHGSLRSIKVGGRRFIPAESLRNLLEPTE